MVWLQMMTPSSVPPMLPHDPIEGRREYRLDKGGPREIADAVNVHKKWIHVLVFFENVDSASFEDPAPRSQWTVAVIIVEMH